MKWLKTEEHSTKREFSPQLNSTPPPKKKIRNDGISTLPPPLSSSEYSSAATKMMEKMGYDKNCDLQCFIQHIANISSRLSSSPSVIHKKFSFSISFI
ncbi:unnamed protein product [Rotaria sordida]|uniref:Uncharacterized protein n=2 Tax=Rotaria sordida TaxID=392033 RepID=A0A818TI21_9BILA|nr:unnamed protein product [Rotaria sordida]CAF4185295.1 unnamed protein product [Rotaria sordida]